jgi:hypothetical protein
VFDDIPAIVEMYRATVHTVNAKDYTPAQIKVWADGAVNYPRWEKAINEQYFRDNLKIHPIKLHWCGALP